jgi:uncharacterized protein
MTAPLLIYLHGFLSSPGTRKAALLAQIPALPDKPQAAMQAAEAAIIAAQARGCELIGLLGSSMGGFYATILAQRYALRTVLINPAVQPQHLIAGYLRRQRNPYTGVEFDLDSNDVAELQRINPALTRPELFWLLTQIGDEVLDYRDAVNLYAGCRQTVEPGGDHQFQHFERHLPDIVNFFINFPESACPTLTTPNLSRY